MTKRKILVYPCGTEIGLEIYKALSQSPHYELYGGSSNDDHGRFVYQRMIDELPFITDHSTDQMIREFADAIKAYQFDLVYPAMDGVLTVFSKYRDLLPAKVIAPDYETTGITRSKKETYRVLRDQIPVPTVYENKEMIEHYPVFCKPDVGQGAVGAQVIDSKEELDRYLDRNQTAICTEYMPGKEYTVDCFTNAEGSLLYARGRERKRIRNGISVHTSFVNRPDFLEYAKKINAVLHQKGGWFFQLKETETGEVKLLEVSSRIAGTSALSRCAGVNLPLLTADLFSGIPINDVIQGAYDIEMDRALENRYKVALSFQTVYIDYDDTLILNGKVNIPVIAFLFSCMNKGKKIVLLTKHEGDLGKELTRFRLDHLFDEVIHIKREEEKWTYVDRDSLFIDDSYGERKKVHENSGATVFDTAMIECLF